MTIQRMDHVGVVVEDLEAAISFFVELGMELDGGTTPVEGDWVDRVVGLDDVRVEIAFVRTPDGYGRLELTKFHNPTATTASVRWRNTRISTASATSAVPMASSLRSPRSSAEPSAGSLRNVPLKCASRQGRASGSWGRRAATRQPSPCRATSARR